MLSKWRRFNRIQHRSRRKWGPKWPLELVAIKKLSSQKELIELELQNSKLKDNYSMLYIMGLSSFTYMNQYRTEKEHNESYGA